MKPKISIIVPVYNRSKILAECLGNLVHQTLIATTPIEIIVVNDASTDNSLSIIQQCKSQFPELIRFIDSPKNMGPGGARNLGIEAAKGQYIGFVDSDDLADPSMYEKLLTAAEQTSYDIIDCGYYRQENDLAIVHTADEQTGILDDKKRMELIVSGGYLFSKLYRKELFQDPNLRFRSNVILEDADFLTYLFSTAASIGNIKEILYYYRNQPDSASKIIQTDKYYFNIYEAMQAIYEKTYCLPNYSGIRPAIEYELLQMYSYGINICIKAHFNQESRNLIQMLADLADLKNKVIHGGYDNPYVQAKINALDIQIMQLNDQSPEQLLQSVHPNLTDNSF